MSELKTYKMVDEKYCDDCVCVIPSEVYLKSDADKVIAELENRIDEGDKEFDIANEQNERLLKIVRHHKYKRCLAMVKYCHESAMWLEEYGVIKYATFMLRWQKRWLELAEKFKEVK